ncbi:hypothetical protein L1987_18612 [Smallanthus sonchifolius]|uniref:Uncharacterized protein n=1 Tax=Smallanthus sonchifolius TaxID=185202 RepID=A0ACB9J0K2_9ASTR|nr:hypothetical protein L1987_18612 [Smallanthus sonchifolius]
MKATRPNEMKSQSPRVKPSDGDWNPRRTVNNLSYIDSGCSRHTTGDISPLYDLQNFNGGYVSFAGGKGGKISMKGTMVNGSLSFNDLSNVSELNQNMLSVSQICDKDYSSKNETAALIKNFNILVENQRDVKVKDIRCDNGTEFKNAVLSQFCTEKGIARQYSVARTPQPNDVAERKNRTLIEAARTMISESKQPLFFWAEAVNTVCYVLNQVLLNKRLQMNPYEILYNENPRFNDEDDGPYTGPMLTVDPPEVLRPQSTTTSSSSSSPEHIPEVTNVSEGSQETVKDSTSMVNEGTSIPDTTDASKFQEPIPNESVVEKSISDNNDEPNEEIQDNLTNLTAIVQVPETPSHRINKDHAVRQHHWLINCRCQD